MNAKKFLILAALLVILTPFLILLKSKNILSLDFSQISSSSIVKVFRGEPKILNKSDEDAPNQTPLANPPLIIKGVYATGWTAGSSHLNYLIDLIKETELNAIVIDIKDFSGHLSYKIDGPDFASSGALAEIRIPKINLLLKTLHENNVYVIGRITVFQDPILAESQPALALKNKINGKIWTDDKGLAWLDPASQEVWDYNIKIAKDAFSRGFDEINFDYVRFASDGNLENIAYPFWDGKTPKSKIIEKFFSYLRQKLPNNKISADLFGLSTIDLGDMGIGQVIESAYRYFDYVDPMVYPSHYASGFLSHKNPAKYPYEVVKFSLDNALGRLNSLKVKIKNSTSTSEEIKSQVIKVRLRPWLQDFDLGATYNAEMVGKEISATYDSLTTSTLNLGGWLLWSPANVYTKGALLPK